MGFSQEDKSIWFNSEVMREFEKIAQETELLDGPPKEAFLPLMDEEEEKTWEEEEDLESAIGDAADILSKDVPVEEDEKLKIELASLYMNNLLSNMQDLAHDIAEQGRNKIARHIEVTINMIKSGGIK